MVHTQSFGSFTTRMSYYSMFHMPCQTYNFSDLQDDQAGSVLWHAAMHLAPGIDYFQPSLVLKVLWEILTGVWRRPVNRAMVEI